MRNALIEGLSILAFMVLMAVVAICLPAERREPSRVTIAAAQGSPQ